MFVKRLITSVLTLLVWVAPASALNVRFLLDNSYSMDHRVSGSRVIDMVYHVLGDLLSEWPETASVSAVEWSHFWSPVEHYTPASLASYFSAGKKMLSSSSFLGKALEEEQLKGCVHHVIVTNDEPYDVGFFKDALADALTDSMSVTVVMAPYSEKEYAKALSWYRKLPAAENFFVLPLAEEEATNLWLLREHMTKLSALPDCNAMMM